MTSPLCPFLHNFPSSVNRQDEFHIAYKTGESSHGKQAYDDPSSKANIVYVTPNEFLAVFSATSTSSQKDSQHYAIQKDSYDRPDWRQTQGTPNANNK